MTKLSLGIIALIPVICVGCTQSPLTAAVVGVPTEVRSGQTIKLQVRIYNRSRVLKSLPFREIVQRTTGLEFIQGSVLKNPKLGEYPINRVSLDICPPGFDWIPSEGEFIYDFTWTPEPDDKGSGALYVSLPFDVPQIPPLVMTIAN